MNKMQEEKVLNQVESIQKKGRVIALLPIIVFLVTFLGAGIVSGDFYAMPAIVGFLLALFVAFLQNRTLKFSEKFKIVAAGAGDENIVTMLLIFLCAGGFSGAVKAAGGVESTVNFGLSILPAKVAVMGLFIIGCFISVSMGTSMGTIAALGPIASGISSQTGFSLPICIGAVVCGAMFGDNLSMVSDTTIAAVKSQGCNMKDKFRANFVIVLPAAVATALIFLLITSDLHGDVKGEALSYNLWKVLPYIIVLVGAVIGINVFLVLIGGMVVSLIVGVATGSVALSQIFNAVGEGVFTMYDITVISFIVACIISLVKEYGGISFILNLIKSRIRDKKAGELGIAALSLLVDMCTANNTIAIVMAGPIAKEISEDFGISPKRSASLLDIFTSVGQGTIPYGAQLLSAASLTGVTPFMILPYLFYPILMAFCALFSIFFEKRERASDSKVLKKRALKKSDLH